MSIKTVKTGIINKLNDMQTLKQVHGFESSNVAGNYPIASVTLSSGRGEFRSTAHNLRNRFFTVRVYQELMDIGQGNEQAETIIANVLDELETAFDMDTTLSGTAKYVHPAEWEASYAKREHDARILTITLEAIELVSAQ